jgi:hypothetical protein
LRRLWPEKAESDICVAVLVAGIYPAWLTFAGYAFTTTAFAAAFLASVLSLSYWQPGRAWSIVPHSFLTAFVFWIHPTGGAVALTSILAVGLVAARRGNYAALLLHVAIVACAILIYLKVVHPWMNLAMTPQGYSPNTHYPSLMGQLELLIHPGRLLNFVAMVGGSAANMAVATAGIGVVGILYCLERTASDRFIGTSSSIWILISLSPIAIAALGAISLLGFEQTATDFWIYGRYLEGALLPALAIGVLGFRRGLRNIPVAIAVGLVGLLLALRMPAHAPNNIIDTVGFWPQILWPELSIVFWMIAGAIVVAIAGLLGRFPAFIIFTVVSAVNVYGQTKWHNNLLSFYSAPPALAKMIRDNFPQETCVGFNPKLPDNAQGMQQERYLLYSFYLFNYGYRRMTPVEWSGQCDGPYLTYSLDDEAIKAFPVVAREIASSLYLIQKTNDGAVSTKAVSGVQLFKNRGDYCFLQSCLVSDGFTLAQSSLTGQLSGNTLSTNGRPGFLFFGPYMPMSKGSYVLTISGAFADSEGCVVDVSADTGKSILASSPLAALEIDKNGKRRLHVKLDHDVIDLEIRMQVSASTKLDITGYEFRQE